MRSESPFSEMESCHGLKVVKNKPTSTFFTKPEDSATRLPNLRSRKILLRKNPISRFSSSEESSTSSLSEVSGDDIPSPIIKSNCLILILIERRIICSKNQKSRNIGEKMVQSLKIALASSSSKVKMGRIIPMEKIILKKSRQPRKSFQTRSGVVSLKGQIYKINSIR